MKNDPELLTMRDSLKAFCKHCDVRIEGATDGPLAGLKFAAKDLYDVAGFQCCAGNPDWLRTHPPAASTAPAVAKMIEAGATLVGKTIMDEMAYSLGGENIHYGTPLNPAAPDCTPGGSSSGSASAVAGGVVDFALGSDTGGSVRVPASYCGIYGIRTTHGAVSTLGMVPHVPSADTVGWFTRDADLLRKIGTVMLADSHPDTPSRILIADDLFSVAEPDVREAIEAQFLRLAKLGARIEHARVTSGKLEEWRLAYVTIQGFESWASHGEWIRRVKPSFSDAIRERYEAGARVSTSEYAEAKRVRESARNYIDSMFRDGTVICAPSASNAAPRIGEGSSTAVRTALQNVTCVASLCGLPQVSIPGARLRDGRPVGLSLIGPRGSDMALLEAAVNLSRT